LLALLAALTLPSGVAAQPRRAVIAVGANHGAAGEEPLLYAEQDAQRFADLFTEIGGADPALVAVVRGGSAQDVRDAIERIATALGAAPGSDIELLFYYAGHGDQQALHLGHEQLSVESIRAVLESAPSPLRVMIVDSCQGSGASRSLGVIPGESFQIQVAPPSPKGTVLVTSASPGEPAQESDQLRGAVFSHYLFSGLRGPADVDTDGQITLQEAYDFAYARTLLRTAGDQGSLQHPGFDLDLSGTGNVILTHLQSSSASLTFDADPQAHYVIFRMPALTPMAEVPANPDQATRLALPAGRYLVQARGGTDAGIQEIHLPWGGNVAVEREAFHRTASETLTRRGGPRPPAHVQLSLGYRGTPWGSTTGGRGHGGTLSIVRAQRRIGLGISLSASHAPMDLQHHTGRELRVGLCPQLRVLLDRSPWAFRLGVGVLVEPSWQWLTHRGAARLDPVGLESSEQHSALALGGLGHAGVSLFLHRALFLDAELGGGARIVRMHDDLGRNLDVQPQLHLTVGLGLAL